MFYTKLWMAGRLSRENWRKIKIHGCYVAEWMPQLFCIMCLKIILFRTRTTRTPAFWGYPRRLTITILLSHIGSQVKRRQSQSYKFKESAKISLFKFWNKLYTRHAFWMSIVEDTERTWFFPQTDRRTRLNQYIPFQLRWSGGIITATSTRSQYVTVLYDTCGNLQQGAIPKLYIYISNLWKFA